jgi:predicted ATPase
MVRELAERGVLEGKSGAYLSTAGGAEVSVPATLQATIAARIDRLPPEAKRALGAAAVIGSPFDLDLLTAVGVEPNPSWTTSRRPSSSIRSNSLDNRSMWFTIR